MLLIIDTQWSENIKLIVAFIFIDVILQTSSVERVGVLPIQSEVDSPSSLMVRCIVRCWVVVAVTVAVVVDVVALSLFDCCVVAVV